MKIVLLRVLLLWLIISTVSSCMLGNVKTRSLREMLEKEKTRLALLDSKADHEMMNFHCWLQMPEYCLSSDKKCTDCSENIETEYNQHLARKEAIFLKYALLKEECVSRIDSINRILIYSE